MAYTEVGMINLALGRIGVARIASITEDSPQALAAAAVWEYIFDLVTEARDWKFAKFRATLTTNAGAPVFGYGYKWNIPTDFLRIAKGTEDDPSFAPSGYAYKLEAVGVVGSAIIVVVTNYATAPVLAYIQRQTAYTLLSPGFVNALAYRLAAEMAIKLPEGISKFRAMMELYSLALRAADEQNAEFDYFDTVDNWGNDRTLWADQARAGGNPGDQGGPPART